MTIDPIRSRLRVTRTQLDETRRQLSAAAESLATRMTALVAALERDGDETNINELGEVQGDGARVDCLCSRFQHRREMIHILESLRERAG